MLAIGNKIFLKSQYFSPSARIRVTTSIYGLIPEMWIKLQALLSASDPFDKRLRFISTACAVQQNARLHLLTCAAALNMRNKELNNAGITEYM